MGEALFYQLCRAPLERSLPGLLAKSLERGWKVVVRAGSDAQVQAVDDMLWTYDDMSFLPHGTATMGHQDVQPVYLTAVMENPIDASVLMLVEGARLACEEAPEFDRICLVFNGNEPDQLNAARADWTAAKDAGLTAKYWAQQDGTWVQKASSGG